MAGDWVLRRNARYPIQLFLSRVAAERISLQTLGDSPHLPFRQLEPFLAASLEFFLSASPLISSLVTDLLANLLTTNFQNHPP